MGDAADDLYEAEQQIYEDRINMRKICRKRGCTKPHWEYDPKHVAVFRCKSCDATYDPQ